MSSVEVQLGILGPKPTTGERRLLGGPIVTATLPRAYISAFGSYSQNALEMEFRDDVLPDKMRGNHLRLSMAYPDGFPYSVVYQTWPKHKPDMSNLGVGVQGPQLKFKDDQLRAIVIHADIAVSEALDVARDITTIRNLMYHPTGQTYEGSERFEDAQGKWQPYGESEMDGISLITCMEPVERALAFQFCKYYVPLNDKVKAELDFIDFRLNGGRQFARQRVRAFKKVMCPLFHCDRKAIESAKVGEK